MLKMVFIFLIIYILLDRLTVILANIDYKKAIHPYSRLYNLQLSKKDTEKISKLQFQIEDKNQEILSQLEKSKQQLGLIKDILKQD